MHVSNPSSRVPSEPAQRALLPKWLIIAAFGFSFLGFVDATYLTVKTFQGGSISCSLTNGCDVVAASGFSHIAGIPIALLGALYYFVMLLGLFLYTDTGNQKIVRVLGWVSIAPFLFSLWLTYVQWKILEAFCQYCLFSALTSTMLFVLGMCMVVYSKQKS